MTLSSAITLDDLNNVSIIGYNNITVHCVNGGGLKLWQCSDVIIEGITWIGCGKYDNTNDVPVIELVLGSIMIRIQKCTFQYSLGKAISLDHVLTNAAVIIDNCKFMNNEHYRGHGTAIFFSHVNTNVNIQIANCIFHFNGEAESIVYVDHDHVFSDAYHSIYLNTSSFFYNQGVSVYLPRYFVTLHIIGEVLFENNVAESGAGIYINNNSTIAFNENSNVKFINNSVDHNGTAILINHFSNVIFEQNSKITFQDNKATKGTIYCKDNSNVTFKTTCEVTFSSNLAIQYGAAIYSSDNCHVTFTENSKVTFSNNVVLSTNTYGLVLQHGGTIYSENNSSISFEDNSFTMFTNNVADYGAAIFSFSNSCITFKHSSRVMFNNNNAVSGGAMCSIIDSHIIFKEKSSAMFDNNAVTNEGGAIYTLRSNVSFEGFSTVVFRKNVAEYGGVVFTQDQSDIIFSDDSKVKFTNNSATFGATAFSNTDTKIIATGNSTVILNDRSAKWCNSTCLPYTAAGQGDIVTIDSNGIVWCSDQKAFVCVSKECDCNKFEDLLDGLESNTSINITNTVTLSSVITLEDLNNVSIIGYNNITVNCVDGGGLKLWQCSNLTIEGITWIGCGKYDNTNDVPVIDLVSDSIIIRIQKCTFQYSLGKAISLNYVLTNVAVIIDNCNFMIYNHYRGHGAAIFFLISSNYEININIANCIFQYNGEAESIILIARVVFRYINDYHLPCSIYLNTSSFYSNQGASVYLFGPFTLHINGDVLFENNIAESGAGIYINNSTVIFDENSNVKFINNSVDHNGTAIFTNHFSNVIFEQNCDRLCENQPCTHLVVIRETLV